jgi:hypothetical protein
MQQQQPRASMRDQVNGTLAVFYWLIVSHETCIVPFIRCHFGSKYFGLNAIGSLVIILLYAMATESTEMVQFFYWWLGALIVQRVITFRDLQEGRVEHTRFSGQSAIARFFKSVSGPGECRTFEAMLCLAVGALLTNVSDPLGKFVMAGFLSIKGGQTIDYMMTRARMQAMNDAEIEARQTMQQYRGRH